LMLLFSPSCFCLGLDTSSDKALKLLGKCFICGHFWSL
jgi:hypothetical protein